MKYPPKWYLVCQKVGDYHQLVPYEDIDEMRKAIMDRDSSQVRWAVVGSDFKIPCDTLAEALQSQAQNKNTVISLIEPRNSLSSEGRLVYYTAPISAPTV
jgi:hypothetical protein